MADKQTLFISYCQKDGTQYADELENQFKEFFEVYRDKSKLNVNDDIDEFMEKIAECDNVVIVLTEEYLKSFNCMLEVSNLFEHKDWDYKVTVLVKDDTIYSIDRRLEVLSYWENEKEKADLYQGDNKFVEERKNRLTTIADHLEQFLSGISKRNNPSQIAIVNEVIKNAKSPEVQKEKQRILSDSQKAVLDFIGTAEDTTLSDIMMNMGWTKGYCLRVIKALSDAGYIERVGASHNLKYRRVV